MSALGIRWPPIYGVMLRDWYTVRRNLPLLVELLFWPTLGVVTWGLVTVFLAPHLPTLVAALLGATLLWQLGSHPQTDLARCFLEDVWSRNLVNLYTTPLSTLEHLCGMVLSGFIRIVFSSVLMCLLAWALYGFGVFTLGPALLGYAIGLLLMAWSLGIIAIGLVVRFGASAQTIAWVLAAALQPFAAVFYPVEVLPRAIQVMAWLVPASWIFEDMRTVLAGGDPAAWRLIVSFLLNIAYLLGALAFLDYGLRHARHTGRLSRAHQ